MPGPTFMVQEIRGSGGNAIARILRGATFAELLGATGVTSAKDTGSAATTHIGRSTMCRYRGLIYAATYTGVYVLDPIAGLWALAHGFTASSHSPSDLVVVDTPSGDYLVTFFGSAAGGDRWTRFDGTSWVDDVGPGANRGIFQSKLFVHKGLVYEYGTTYNDASHTIASYDPVTRTPARVSVAASQGLWLGTTASYFSLDDRLFIVLVNIRGTGGGFNIRPEVYEFKLGSWVYQSQLTALPFMSQNRGSCSAIRIAEAVYWFSGDQANFNGLRCMKFTVPSPGANIAVAELTAPIPPPLRTGSAIGTPGDYRLYGFVDTITTPGTASGYLWFFPDATTAAIPTLFQWNGEGAEMTAAASPQIVGSSGVPVQFFGGGENVNGLGTTTSPLATTSPEGNAQGSSGVVVSFSAWGDPIVLPHDASGGAFTAGLVVTQAPSGASATILRVGPNELWLTQDSGVPWVNGQAITDTSTGSANQNAATTGGANDKTVEARYYLGAGPAGIGVPVSGIATIVPGSVTGGGGATDAANQIVNVTADGRTFSFEWDFLTDGIPQALIDNLELFITRP